MKDFFDNYLSKLFRQSVLNNIGMNIPKDRRLNCSNKEITISKGKDNYVVYFALPFDNDLLQALDLDSRAVPYDGIYNNPEKGCKCRDIIEITYDDIANVLKELPFEQQTPYVRWLSRENREAFEAQRKQAKEQAVAKIKGLPLVRLTRKSTKADFLHLLYCLDYRAEDNELCWNAYNKDWKDFPGSPDYVSENRAFYAISAGKYFVVSKNLYDVFFASQGNGFESCFSLTSQHRYIRGVPYWMAHAGYYMCYITNGDITKWSAIPGHKLKLPQMSCRAWGYKLLDGSFGIGKTYDKTGNRSLMWEDSDVSSLFAGYKPNSPRKVDGDKFDFNRYSVYYDNLNTVFEFESSGMCGKGSTGKILPIYNTLKLISNFSNNIEFMPKALLTDGAFLLKEILPKSGLVKTKLNQLIEDMLTDKARVDVNYCYVFFNGEKNREEVVQGESDGPKVNFYVNFYPTGKITIQKEDENETVIASI